MDREALAGDTYLKLRGRTYYLERRVPTHLVSAIGRTHIPATGTRDNVAGIEALLDALPFRAPLNPPVIRQIPLVTWSGKPSPIYNGFTSDERLHLWQLVKWLMAQGAMSVLVSCDICGSHDRLQHHSENYYNPFQAAVVCAACHRLIHLRFWRWSEWRELCKACDPKGAKWYSLLTLEQPDIASYIREKHGPQVSDLLNSPLYRLPDSCGGALMGIGFQN